LSGGCGDDQLVTERGVTATWYGLTGVLNALWGATLPATDVRLDLGEGGLGVLLTALAAGALVGMPVAGRLARRWPGLLRVTGPAAALALTGPAVAPSAPLLVVSAVVLGVVFGALNVALSLRAVAVERALGTLIMATMHGTWTLGAVVGGAAVTAALHAGVGVDALLIVGAVVLAAAMATISSSPVEPTTRVEPASTARPGLIVLLGVIGAAAFVTEGAATDWAGVHATRVLGADPAIASLVYTVFFAAMTVVRFVGDAVRTRLGGPVTIRLAGGVATAGYGLVLLSGALSSVGVAMAGWVLAGAGMAMVWPIVVSALGAAGGRLSAVTMISYGGGLLGPSVIGFVAAGVTLPVALLIPAALALVVATVAPAVLSSQQEKKEIPCSPTRSTPSYR
jgi:MFS family permease